MHASSDIFYEIDGPKQGLYREKGSKFIGFLSSLHQTENLKEMLLNLRKQHPKARHFCFAYLTGWAGEIHRAFDDGEPSGTAGMPILQALRSSDLSNVCCIVVRYYGGKKLGAAGLNNAYKQATLDALQQVERVEMIRSKQYHLSFDYALMSKVMSAIKQLGMEIKSQQMTDIARLVISVSYSTAAETLQAFQCDSLDIYEKDIRSDMNYGVLKIDEI